MGTLAIDAAETPAEYGQLANRFNGLRAFYGCVRDQINNHKSAAECVK